MNQYIKRCFNLLEVLTMREQV